MAARSWSPALIALLVLAGCGNDGATPAAAPPPPETPACAPGSPALELAGAVTQADARTYRVFPFAVAPGTGRVELSYGWTDRAGPPSTPATATTLDLGLWDQHGYRAVEGFRGWSGSRQGRIDQEQAPVFVEAAQADRGYSPRPIVPGTWYAELGVGAVSPQGASFLLRIECKTAGGSAPALDPVDAAHVARAAAGWYHADFHMHAYHSNPRAPDWDEFIALARAAQLDVLMVTEYVTGEHWRTLGAVQRAHPDLLIWPGREVITYFGHVMGLGETPRVLEYRHGFEDVDIGGIQRLIKADGALFQVNHPTTFPGPLFSNFCRGCEFTLGDRIDWDQVDTIEILNGPVMVTGDDIGLDVPGQMENPFMTTAIRLWDDLLLEGHKITGVSGSDSKGVEPDPAEFERRGYGSSATAVHAASLSRAAVGEAIRAGRAYVRTRGVARSPALEFTATGPGGQSGMFGDTLAVDLGEAASLRTTVTGGTGQVLRYVRNGLTVLQVPVLADPFVHELPLAVRDPLTEGPLGTYYRIETLDSQSRTTLGNPIFLRAP